MALLAALVIFTVIARYCFSLSWKQLAEFNTTLFAFTTFWGMGINVIKDEHVMIDIIYDGVKPARKRWLAIVNYLIVLAVDLVFTYQGFKYVGVAGKQISQIKNPKWYLYDRSTLTEYDGFGENADRMRAIGKVFPVMFFLVAALISLTGMTRMVEEQRIEIGTMKALGYGNFSIASKYLGYAFLATAGGSVLGVLVGEKNPSVYYYLCI